MKLISLLFVCVFSVCFLEAFAHPRINKCVFICDRLSIKTCARDIQGNFHKFQNDCERKQKACAEDLSLVPVKYELCDQTEDKNQAKKCIIKKCDRFANTVCAIDQKIIRQFGSKCEMDAMGCAENKVFLQVKCPDHLRKFF